MKQTKIYLLSLALMALTAEAHQVTVQSSVTGDPVAYEIDHGATVRLLATADAGSQFVRWSDGNTANPRTVVVNSDASYVAVFEASGGGSLPQKCKATIYGGGSPFVGEFDKGSQLNIVAVPLPGYKFVRWTDGNTTNPRNLTLNADITLHAEYETYNTPSALSMHTINVQAAGVEEGFEGRFPTGTELTLVARPDQTECDIFAHWENESTSPTRNVTVTDDATYIAEFGKIQYTVRGQNSNGGKVVVEK